MANHYVNTAADAGGDGTTTDLTGAHCAWDTIADVNAHSFSPDDFVYFKCGCTWYEMLTVPSAGTSGHQITFASYGSGAKPKISGASAAAPTTPVRNYCVYDTDARGYITLDGLEFAYAKVQGVANDQWTAGAEEVATPTWIVQNCTFTKCGCILFGPDSIVQDSIFVGPQPTTTDVGAIIIRGVTATNCKVLRNTVSGYYGRGIWFMNGVDTPTANDNVVHDILFTYGTSGEGYGINFDGYGALITGTVTATGNTVYECASNGIEMENCSDGSLISQNLVHDCDRSGIIYMNYAAGEGYGEQRGNSVGGVVAYNIIYRCHYLVEFLGVSDVKCWNNVIHEGVGSYPQAFMVDGPSSTYVHDLDIRNNVIKNGGATAISAVFSVPHEVGGYQGFISAFDYNAVPASDTTIVEEVGEHWWTLANVQGDGYMTHGFSTDPDFVDAVGHDYHLNSTSPCIDTGTDVGLTEDYEGNPIT